MCSTRACMLKCKSSRTHDVPTLYRACGRVADSTLLAACMLHGRACTLLRPGRSSCPRLEGGRLGRGEGEGGRKMERKEKENKIE